MSVLPLPNRSDRSAGKPCANTGQTGTQTGQTGPAKIESCTLSPQVCNLPTPLDLRVSLHDLPPLCIPADELDTTGVEVDVLGS